MTIRRGKEAQRGRRGGVPLQPCSVQYENTVEGRPEWKYPIHLPPPRRSSHLPGVPGEGAQVPCSDPRGTPERQPAEAPATTGLLNVPMPVISMSTVSPALIGSACPSVPIHRMSPGCKVMYLVISTR